ncbi:hypothetical protein AALO_G00271580 [Alosa alosa]|uniref:Uncharacterized protein n=1 Tax=Alosa alosa TaxID=278164 RepID=A0AAV6FME1_9TELE|nr:hypothetical protein AALO_G00271580 [Alosa alosa]
MNYRPGPGAGVCEECLSRKGQWWILAALRTHTSAPESEDQQSPGDCGPEGEKEEAMPNAPRQNLPNCYSLCPGRDPHLCHLTQ